MTHQRVLLKPSVLLIDPNILAWITDLIADRSPCTSVSNSIILVCCSGTVHGNVPGPLLLSMMY